MPKSKPDQVITYRIEFQETERRLLSDLIMGNNVAQVGKAVDDLLTFENLYIAATLYEIVTGDEILMGTPNDLEGLLEAIKVYIGTNDPDGGNSSTGGGGNWYQNLQQNRADSGRYGDAAGTVTGGIFNLISNLFRPILDPPEI